MATGSLPQAESAVHKGRNQRPDIIPNYGASFVFAIDWQNCRVNIGEEADNADRETDPYQASELVIAHHESAEAILHAWVVETGRGSCDTS